MINFNEIKRFVSYIAVGMVTVMFVFTMLVLEVSPFIAIFIGFFISLVMGFFVFCCFFKHVYKDYFRC